MNTDLSSFFGSAISSSVFEAIDQLNRLWDEFHYEPSDPWAAGLTQFLSQWVGYGISLSDPLKPTIALFLNGAPFGWLFSMMPRQIAGIPIIPVDGIKFHALPPGKSPAPGSALPRPGAELKCQASDPSDPSLAVTEFGTLGVFLGDNAGTTYILSANHVLAFNNVFPEREIQLGEKVVSRDAKFVPIQPGEDNAVDAAISPYSGDPIQAAIPGLALTSRTAMSPIGSITRVSKVGAGSAASSGALAFFSPRLEVTIPSSNLVDVNFIDQYLVKDSPSGPFSAPGDSGSLAVIGDGQNREPFGMLIADGFQVQGDRLTVVTPFNTILKALKDTQGIGLDLQILT